MFQLCLCINENKKVDKKQIGKKIKEFDNYRKVKTDTPIFFPCLSFVRLYQLSHCPFCEKGWEQSLLCDVKKISLKHFQNFRFLFTFFLFFFFSSFFFYVCWTSCLNVVPVSLWVSANRLLVFLFFLSCFVLFCYSLFIIIIYLSLSFACFFFHYFF